MSSSTKINWRVKMVLSISTLFLFLSVTLYARKRAGGHLTPPSHSMATVEPAYWLTKRQREAMELWRSIGTTSLWISCLAAVVLFVQFVKGF